MLTVITPTLRRRLALLVAVAHLRSVGGLIRMARAGKGVAR